MDTPEFPNGFDSWQKTHFEVVEVLAYMRSLDDSEKPRGFAAIFDQSASQELYQLALDLTNKFEAQSNGKERKRTLFDEIEDFVWGEVKTPGNIV